MEYFSEIESSSVPFQSSPFPTITSFVMELFQAVPLSEVELITYTKRFKGSYNNWTGTLQHTSCGSRVDIGYIIMRLSGYNTCPKDPYFKALHQLMQCILHHLHIPIMYPRKSTSMSAVIKSYCTGN